MKTMACAGPGAIVLMWTRIVCPRTEWVAIRTRSVAPRTPLMRSE